MMTLRGALLIVLCASVVTSQSFHGNPKRAMKKVGAHPKSMSECDGKFVCNSRLSKPECIDKQYMCDGTQHCNNGTDEHSCQGAICQPLDKILCNDKQSCAKLCDGKHECAGDEDEKWCNKNCQPGQFQCADGKCLSLDLVCNGHSDCSGNDDEIGCSKRCKCGSGHYLCADGKTCLPARHVCNNIPECPAGDDEQSCPAGCKCEAGEYLCKGGKNCIKQDQLCDTAILAAWRYHLGFDIAQLAISNFLIPRRDCPANDDEHPAQCFNAIPLEIPN